MGRDRDRRKRLRHIADRVIGTDGDASLPARLKALPEALADVMARFLPDEAAIEETCVNRNGATTLKLSYATRVAPLGPALAGIPVTEYGKAETGSVCRTGSGAATTSRTYLRAISADPSHIGITAGLFSPGQIPLCFAPRCSGPPQVEKY